MKMRNVCIHYVRDTYTFIYFLNWIKRGNQSPDFLLTQNMFILIQICTHLISGSQEKTSVMH